MARRPAADPRRRTRKAEAPAIGPVTPERPLGAVLEFLRALWGVNHALESTSRKMKRELNVTGPERMVVRLVGRYPGISAGDLARILHVHPSTLTGLLKRLVSRGILRRKADAGDGRRALFDLTSRGDVVDGVRRGTTEAAVRATLEQLSDRDIRVTASVLETLQRTLEAGR
jgi:MarR family transcriptional regulator, organic hydroperoxide resistance regulator